MIVNYLFKKKGLNAGQQLDIGTVLAGLEGLFGKVSLSKQHILKRYVNTYEPKYGFRITMQRLHNLPRESFKMMHYVVSQFVPPGRLLRDQPLMGPDVHVFKDYDLGSPSHSLAFSEEMNYVGLPANEKVGILFEAKAYVPGKESSDGSDITTLGWAYYPVFEAVDNENNTSSLYTAAGLI